MTNWGIKGLFCGLMTVSMMAFAVENTYSAADKPGLQEIQDVADGKASAKDVAGKFSIEDIMHAFKPRAKGGIGVGSKAGEIVPDAIELKVNALAKKSLAAPVLTKESAAIIKMANHTKAIGEITLNQLPKKNVGEWKKFTEEMISASKDLATAAKDSPEGVNKAAKKIAASCNDCHAKFRDN